MNVFIRLLSLTALLSVAFAVEPKKLPSSTILKQAGLKENTIKKIETGKRLNRTERKEIKDAEKARYIELRNAGADEVSNTEESIALRNYKLKNKKRKGLIRKREATLADILFPGVSAQDYVIGEPIAVYTDVVESRKRPVPYDYYDLPGCSPPIEPEFRKKVRMRKNLGMRLQGRDLKVAPFDFRVKKNMGCTPMCSQTLDSKKMRWMRRLIAAQYRVQLELDQLPVLMRSKDYNYAVRGYPLGFIAPENFHGLRPGEYYLFNHLRFVVTYHEDPAEFTGVRVTGFDVHPVSVKHQFAEGQVPEGGRQVPPLTTCSGLVDNDPAMYLELKTQGGGLRVVYSYEVEWIESELPWSDRWDVYLIGTPDDELHYFSIVNSLMIVLFLTGAISTIMIRTLKKDIATYSDMDALEDGMEETGWKLVHGDVFRPPQFNPMLLCVLVGNGGQIGAAFGLSMLAGVLKMLNPMQKGQTLTCLIILYVLCGSVSGYTSARLYKYMDGKRWKINIILTAVGLPGILVSIFIFLNIWLSFAGAATAVSIFTIIKLFLLWALVSTPLVFLGGFIGFKVDRIEVPCKINQIARVVPLVPWHVQPQATFFMGGILPFGSVCIELAFIMSALWLHQIYYVLGFLLIVWLILVATCAQVSIVLTYLQLCAEDHRWWWNSFLQCSSAGLYLFLYSLYFLVSRLEMVGVLPVVIYLTYMGMISLCFALVCGSVGFLSAFWFTKTIYSAVKID
jgi:transmembrane 9 superfamily protein 2/4